ncbi:family 43 glycosylhydrolase [Specibacter sp. NPDC057265]|uniref:family 43 glycosylhydrolase n=1 Tax=Specibacter sp. NPDC057265 TaxID=3346075 RepID=UPI0036313FBE
MVPKFRVQRRVQRFGWLAAVLTLGALASGALVSSTAGAAGTNLIANPGFESGLSNWSVNQGGNLSITSDAYTGTNAVQVTQRNDTASGPVQDITGHISNGKTYTVSAMVKYENLLSPTTKQFFLTADYGDNSYTNLGTGTVSRGEWGLVSGTFTVPEAQDLSTTRIFLETPWTPSPSADPALHLMDFKVDDVAVKEFEPTKTPEVLGKAPGEGNPLISHKFGADANAFVHEGRTYLYMTNDTQMYAPGADGISPPNTYDRINTITVISSDDLMNWTDHGEIKAAGINGIAKYAGLSWAPAVESKVINGVEKFFLYFANGGGSIAVISGDSPLGPWHDDRGSLLITSATPGASDGKNWLFDPAVFTDADGQSYLFFGGGGDDGTDSADNENHPKSSRVMKLGADMISTVGSAEVIDAPRIFEAGHVFQRGSKYYYSYSSHFGYGGTPEPNAPPNGAIAYMMADSPMGPWTADTYQGVLFRNPGQFFGVGGNNHQSVFEKDGKFYFTYHAQTLNQRIVGSNAVQGFRSPHLAELEFNQDGTINEVTGTFAGVDQTRNVDPYRVMEAETIAWQKGIATKGVSGTSPEFGPLAPNLVLEDVDNGDWTSMASVDFGNVGAEAVTARVLPLVANSEIQIRLDDRASVPVGTISTGDALGSWTEVSARLQGVSGVHDVYFTYAGADGSNLMEVDSWAFETAASRPLAVPAVVGTRCLGGKVLVTVQATNGESVPVSVSVSSAYGSKAFASVAPGKNVAHAFTTRARSVPAGTVTVEASASINGSPVTTSVQAGYDAKTCN